MNLSEEELNAFLRDDFEEFIARSFSELNPGELYLPNWHISVLAQALEEVRCGKTKRLVINVPPRSLKSLAASVAFSAWVLGHDPSKKIICASYSQDLADKHADDTREVMDSDFYQELFPSTRLASSRRSASLLKTTMRGYRLATSVGGSATGHGADFIIIDDPIKSSDTLSSDQLQRVKDWYTTSVPSRLNSLEDGAIVIVMQRLHEHDLVGYVQRNEEWNVVNLPAIAEKDESFTVHSICGVDTLTRGIGDALHPERASRESLRSLFYKIGEASFYAQYQQAPLSSERSDEDVIGWPEGDEFDVVFQSWDISSDASHPFDCCAGSMWGVKGGKLYLLYLMQSPMVQGQAINFIDKMAEVGAPQLILLDDRTSGQHYAAALRPKFNVQVSAMNIAKAERIRMATQLLASDRVEIPWKAPWLDPFRRPLLAFSEDRDFDGEDSVSQALYWFQNHSAF